MSIEIRSIELTGLTHLRGLNLGNVLEKLTAVPLDIFRYTSLPEEGEAKTPYFVAKLGEEELLVNVPQAVTNELSENQYAFQRGDAVFELSGNWRDLMAEVCIYDFAQTKPGDFSMVLMAGVSVWILIPEADQPLMMGCDPSFGHYLFTTIQRQIAESPFLN